MTQQVMSRLCNIGVYCFVYVSPILALRELLEADVEQQTGAWERKTYLICLDEVAEVKCDGPDQMMEVVSAWYNRNTKDGDNKLCGSFQSDWKSCKVNAKDMVQEQCQDTNICHLQPSDHAMCEDEAFLQMRVVVRCKTADEGAIKKQPARIPSTPLAASETNTRTLPVVNKDDTPAEIAFVPCYRSLKIDKIIDGDVLSDTWRAELASSVTACEPREGCFHLTFPDGLVYTNSEEPPTAEEIVRGELGEASENMWVTYAGVGLRQVDYGIGMKRNDYGTWGICLPKTKTIQEAASLWDSLRKVGAE